MCYYSRVMRVLIEMTTTAETLSMCITRTGCVRAWSLSANGHRTYADEHFENHEISPYAQRAWFHDFQIDHLRKSCGHFLWNFTHLHYLWLVHTDAVALVVLLICTYRIATRKHDQKTQIGVHYGLLWFSVIFKLVVRVGHFLTNFTNLTNSRGLRFGKVSAVVLISATLYVTCLLSRISHYANLHFYAPIHTWCSRWSKWQLRLKLCELVAYIGCLRRWSFSANDRRTYAHEHFENHEISLYAQNHDFHDFQMDRLRKSCGHFTWNFTHVHYMWELLTDAASVAVLISTYRITNRKHDKKTEIAVNLVYYDFRWYWTFLGAFAILVPNFS